MMINPWSIAQSITTPIETNMWIIFHKFSFVNVSPKNLKGLTPQATHFGLMGDFFPTLAPPNSLKITHTNNKTLRMNPTTCYPNPPN